ncbi:MAG TPA: BRO family protein [Methanocorpusculum sp.]|nr:BRO family protein [Methanocorpusculum sp.]
MNPEHFKTFEYCGSLFRATDENGETLFVANDICKALGYTNSHKALSDHCKGVTKRYTLSAGGVQTTNFIREPDLYRLVFRSNKPEAEAFADYVYEVVLPSIRRTGQYSAQSRSLPPAEESTKYDNILRLITQTRGVTSVQLTLDNGDTLTYDTKSLAQKIAESTAKPVRKQHMSASAFKLQQYLIQHEPGVYPYKTLKEELGMNNHTLSRAIRGRKDSHQSAGLMEMPEYKDLIREIPGGDRKNQKSLVWRADILEVTA